MNPLRIVFERIGVDEPVLQSEIQNVFLVKDLNKYAKEDGTLEMPSFALISMMSLSISHSRAIIQQVKDETCEPIIKGLQERLAILTTLNEKNKGKANMYFWIMIGLLLAITVWGYFKIKSLF